MKEFSESRYAPMKTISLSLIVLVLLLWLTPGQNTVQAEDEPAQSPQIPVPADLLGELQASFEELAGGLASAREAVGKVTKQRDAARDRVESLTQVNESLRQESAQLRETLASTRQDLQQANTERAEWQRKSEQLQARLESGDAAYDQLVELRDELRATVDEFGGLQADIADVRVELEAPAERKALKQRVATLEETNEDLTNRVAALQDARTVATKKIQTAEGHLAERADRNQELAMAVQELEDRLQAMEQKHQRTKSDMRERIAGLRQELNTTEQDLEQARERHRNARSELVAMREEAAERKDRINTLTTDLAAFEAAPEQASGKSSTAKSASEAKQADVASSEPAEDRANGTNGNDEGER